jgi:hypothetical protein
VVHTRSWNIFIWSFLRYDGQSIPSCFGLRTTQNDRPEETRVLAIAENGLIVNNPDGIFLYHIPELKATGKTSNLVPVWNWRGDASDLRGTLYKTVSPYPALWLQGRRTTHTLEFDVDEPGCFPTVTNHEITGERPAFRSVDRLKLQGRKGLGIESGRKGEIVFHTGALENPDLTRRLRGSVPGLGVSAAWTEEFKYADLDELTGRIMFVAGLRGPDGGTPYARWLYIADLPV